MGRRLRKLKIYASKHWPVLVLGLCGLFVLALVIFSLVLFDNNKRKHEQEYQQATAQKIQNADKPKKGVCLFSECLFEKGSPEEEQNYSKADLKVQQEVAEWAYLAVLVNIISIVTGAMGLIFIAMTFQSQRKQIADSKKDARKADLRMRAQIAAAQDLAREAAKQSEIALHSANANNTISVRRSQAYLTVVGATIEIVHHDPPTPVFKVTVTLKNIGNSPCPGHRVQIGGTISVRRNHIEPPYDFKIWGNGSAQKGIAVGEEASIKVAAYALIPQGTESGNMGYSVNNFSELDGFKFRSFPAGDLVCHCEFQTVFGGRERIEFNLNTIDEIIDHKRMHYMPARANEPIELVVTDRGW